MSVHTKTRRTRFARKKAAASQSKRKERSIPWREVAKNEIKKYTETGLMVRGARFKAELTQKQLAEKLECSRITFLKWNMANARSAKKWLTSLQKCSM